MSRNANGQGHIRQRKPDLWEGQYSVNENGKRKLRSVYGRTQGEVRKKLSAITADIDAGRYIQPQETTLSQWFDTWASEYLNNVKPGTKADYENHGKLYIKPKLGDIKLQKLTPPMVQAFINGLEKAPSTIKITFAILNKCLSQAVLCGILRNNPCSACILPKKVKKEMQIITDIPGFMKAVKGDKFENLFLTDVFTGMREGEIFGLQWSCVDFENGTIKIDKQLKESHTGKAVYEFTTPKSGKTRIIKPASFVMDVLKKQKAIQAENKLKAGSLFSNPSDLVFTDEYGRHLNRCTVRDHLKKIVSGIGCEKVHFHCLRHTYATISIQNGDDIKSIQQNLGHSSVVITLDLYGHVSEEMRKASSDRMDAFIKDISAG